jgi:hypothetical protein
MKRNMLKIVALVGVIFLILYIVLMFLLRPMFVEEKIRDSRLSPGQCVALAYGFDTLNVYGVEHEEHVKYLKDLNSAARDSVLNAVGWELIKTCGKIPVGTWVHCKLVVIEGDTLVRARYQLPQMLRRYDNYFEKEAFHIRHD